jgi:hypothetical protein
VRQQPQQQRHRIWLTSSHAVQPTSGAHLTAPRAVGQGSGAHSKPESQRFHTAINCFGACNPRLVEQFGSTRRKRQLTAQEMGAVNPESIGGYPLAAAAQPSRRVLMTAHRAHPQEETNEAKEIT